MDRRFALPEEIGAEDIKGMRRQLGMTQKEFAALMRVSKATVVHWENSKKALTGPVILALKLLWEMPDLAADLSISEQELPLRLYYFYKNTLCTLIDVEDSTMRVRIRNYTRKVQFRAFGTNTEPTYEDYKAFLESRCFPPSRDKVKLELQHLGLPFYDPLMIIEKTEGRMAEDDFHLVVERRH